MSEARHSRKRQRPLSGPRGIARVQTLRAKPLVEAGRAPRRGGLAAPANALTRPGALERRLADEALAGLFLARAVQFVQFLVCRGRLLGRKPGVGKVVVHFLQ